MSGRAPVRAPQGSRGAELRQEAHRQGGGLQRVHGATPVVESGLLPGAGAPAITPHGRMPEYRAEFDADGTPRNEADCKPRVKLDVPDPELTQDQLARLFVASSAR